MDGPDEKYSEVHQHLDSEKMAKLSARHVAGA